MNKCSRMSFISEYPIPQVWRSVSKMSIFKIDTKGTCLLCLNPNSSCITIINKNDCCANLTRSAVAFKMLLRYLNVDLMKMSNFPSSSVTGFPSDLKDVNLSLSLCGDCSSVTKDFFELFKTLEGIRLQLNRCFYQLLQFMEKGGKDLDRVQEFERRIKTDEDLISASVAEGLRNEAKEKLAQKLKFDVPRISLVKLSSKPGCGGRGGPEKRSDWNSNLESELCAESPSPILRNKVEGFERICEIRAQHQAVGEAWDADSKPISVLGNNLSIDSNSSKKSNCKVSATLFPLKAPISKKPFKCMDCEKSFTDRRNLTRHRVFDHPTSAFSSRIPPVGLTDTNFHRAVDEIFGESKSISGRNARTSVRECSLCGKHINQMKSMKLHIARCHLEKVVEGAAKVKQEEELHVSGMEGNIKLEHEEMNDMEDSMDTEEVTVEGDKPMFQTQVRKKGEDRPGQSGGYRCELCQKFISDIFLLERHRLQKHLWAAVQDRVPSSISEAKLASALSALMAKAKLISNHNKNNVRECPFCTRQEGHSIKLHLLKFHFEQVVAKAGNPRRKVVLSSIPMRTHFVPKQPIRDKPAPKRRRPKYCCNLCEKLCSSLRSLKTHYRMDHVPPNSNKTWVCADCQRAFSDQWNMRSHRIATHPTKIFAKRIPAGLSAQDFEKALNGILLKSKTMGDRNSTKFSVECPHCGKIVKRMRHLKLHIIRWHLEKIVEAAGNFKQEDVDVPLPQVQPCNTRTKLECIDIGPGDEENGIIFEFETELKPFSI